MTASQYYLLEGETSEDSTVSSTIEGEISTPERIEHLDQQLTAHFKDKFSVQSLLTRSLVSFQANKSRPIYRWYKYKEAFSASLVEYLFETYHVTSGCILDPFAGSGTALFAASSLGLNADGIELLPIGQAIITTKQLVDSQLTAEDLETLVSWRDQREWQHADAISLPELPITKGAYPDQTKEAIEKYLGACRNQNKKVQKILHFALLCVLESVSYARKDGQYLRWDSRSARTLGGKPFSKGAIPSFTDAISAKIGELLDDLVPPEKQGELFPHSEAQGEIKLLEGSCLEIMPALAQSTYDAIITSPPYCNRYDYTRTYALELALLGVDKTGLSELRQQMLSCTVENRAKDLYAINPAWQSAIAVADNHALLQSILSFLEYQRLSRKLNNSGIARMVRGYFYEMACVISECARVLKSGAPLFMVNDNVRYAGVSISVDLILSSFAEQLGFEVETIIILPGQKGNSSQQMGTHGRDPLRKCVYVWRKC